MLLHSLSRTHRRCFVILASLVCVLVSPQARAQSAADGFNPTVTGAVNAIVIQPDGKVILGGIFSSLKPNGSSNAVAASGLVRLNLDGTVDTSFTIPSFTAATGGNTAIGAQVNVLALQSDGKILVGGNFGVPNGPNYLCRLNANGTIDTSFEPTLTGNVIGSVTAICVETATNSTVAGSGDILIGGNFNSIKNGSAAAITRNHVARLHRADGSVDTSWDANANAQVDAIIEQTDGNIVLGGAFTTVNPTYATGTNIPVRSYMARVSGATGALDSTYDPEPNNTVGAMALQSDGKLVIVGSFSSLNPEQPGGGTLALPATVGFVGRLNPDGTVDTNFSAQASANISCVAVTPSGKILIGGNIGSLVSAGTSTVSISNLARLNYDGTYDTTFTPTPNSTVNAIAVEPDGEAVIGGNFTQVTSVNAPNGVARLGVARLDGNGILDQDFNPSAFGGIGVIVVQSDGKYLVGGSFTSISGVTVRNLARLLPSGVIDPTFFNSNPDQAVNAIDIESDGRILIGGPFTHLTQNYGAGDQTVNYIARLNTDGTQDTSFNPDPSGPVLSIITEPDGKFLIAGNFAQLQPNNAATATTALDMARLNTDGTMDTTFLPNPAGTVHAMVIDSSGKYVIAVGEFASLTPTADDITTSIGDIARINLTDGRIDTTFAPQPNSYVYTVALQSNGQIVFGGVFTSITPQQTPIDTTTGVQPATARKGIARVNADGSIDPNFDPEPDNDVLGLSIDPTTQEIYIGGLFQNVQNTHQPYVAKLTTTGAIDPTFSAKVNGVVNVITPLAAQKFIIGGAFTTTTPPGSTTPVVTNHLARFNADGSLDTTFSLTANLGGSINALALEANGELLVGGSFSNIAGVFARNIARFYPDGSFDNVTTNGNGFGPNPDGPVNSIVVESAGSSIYIGGSFSYISGVNVKNLVRINDDASYDSTFDAEPNGPVFVIAPQADGKLVVGGSFTSISSNSTTGAVPVGNLARVAGTNGAIDTTFNPQVNGIVYSAVVMPNGQIIVGGNFTTLAGGSRTNLARLNVDGSLDTTFNANLSGGPVNAVSVEPSGQIVIGGSFTTVGGVAQPYFARLSATGALDTTVSVAVNGPVNAVVLEDGGNATDTIVLGGSFTTVGGLSRNNVARLIPTTASATTVVVDPNYNPNADAAVNTIAFGPNGKAYLGGAFANVTGLPRLGIARLSSAGVSGAGITANSLFNSFTWTLTGEVPEINDVIFESSPDGSSWVSLGAGVRSTTSANSWTLPATTQVPSGDIFILALADAETTQYGSQSEIATVQHFYGTPITSFQSATTATGATGSPFYYEIGTTNSATSFTATGLPPGLTINTALGIISGTPTATGTYTVTLTITNPTGTITQPITIVVNAPSGGTAVGPTARLINLSTSATVSLSQDLVGGFVISGTGSKAVLIRAVGPSLANFGVATPLTQPHLTVFNSIGQTIITAQGSDQSQAIINLSARVGAFPLIAGSTDTSLGTVLAPGTYTYQVTSGDGNTGTALAEVYDADINTYAQSDYLTNISSHGLVDDTDIMVGGFSIGGTGTKTVLVRGIGPGLGNFGISTPLVDPLLNVYNSKGVLIASNLGWSTQSTINSAYPAATAASIAAAAVATGAFALTANSADDAVLLTLTPGIYTAQISTNGGTTDANTGTAMIEVYDYSR